MSAPVDADARALDAALESLRIESRAIEVAAGRSSEALLAATRLIEARSGRLIVSGLGKSGHIAAKMAATFASTGTPAHFVHATEALHGDSGMVVPGDVAILISNSGTTAEVVQFGRMIRALGVPVIAMARDASSPLASLAQVWLDISVEREADPLGLAPTASTTLTLALGDALAAALMTRTNFDDAAFGLRHPGGALGQQLGVDE
ncbi:Arabinose-5-phosphate isomerase [Beutenbergia cavernae DSM 12333]|uniref:Arabinose-5-phosphate isomerase n=1 Tax=Beutenbergia cavernae (strain ATCC BAA-8 / DSM 12333 / CCUG 43141 / JCM 11478 / NBRC 16432 / NCIMB 13614 / HKI 0122) TaxID=471853 RepID=C5C447_BEUC1|nr:SIS domain-containing protein [Beutenbergia cavernae]ACQ79960.1 Arabinose-5-phosphate isomerase [Beutenbergia cavernae DSM 12333]